jgi:ATP-dependent helicase/nuclease subunit A
MTKNFSTHVQPQTTDDPNILQSRASNPQSSIWVGASAGTGKTKVLTDRVLRLLLPDEQGQAGSAAHQILCLTFTKAAAREMALRINKTLSRWAIADDLSLSAELSTLLGFTPNAEILRSARQLFAKIVDAPGGINIMTIHSFCQSVLGRFPLESGISPSFEVLDEHSSALLLKQAQQTVLLNAQADQTHPVHHALSVLGAAVNDAQLSSLIQDAMKERRQFRTIIKDTPDYGALYHKLCAAADISTDINKNDLMKKSLAQDASSLREICAQALTGTSKNDLARGQNLADFLAADWSTRTSLYDTYKSIFLTEKREPRASVFTQHVTKSIPHAQDTLAGEIEHILELEETFKSLDLVQNTHALLVLCAEILNAFEALKTDHNTLDFDDLILCTLKLLQTKGQAGWVMYKLDRGLHHILVDEAQDTNPEQWGIIKALTQEFFAGDSQAEELERQRSVFVVGDEKQSIYSFQRASPQEFDNTRQHFLSEAQTASYAMSEVDLNTSFRSAQAVLNSVDSVFASDTMRAGLGPKPVQHISFRQGQAGHVELWPLVTPNDCLNDADAEPDKTESDLWGLPTHITSQTEPQFLLAEQIADQIEHWITSGEELPSRGRAITPGDIMILMRTRVRNGFLGHLTKSLKAKNIAVGSADRITLLDHIGVQDFLALANFALLPSDDLSLACVLKSPLVGWDDDDLMAVALDRSGTLWNTLKHHENHKALCEYLDIFISQAGHLDPFSFFSMALQSPCPANATSGMNGMVTRLGQDAIDPLHCFIDTALQYENSDIQTLQDFVHAISSQDSNQKRDMEDAGNAVRIMTVHGSKGLQSPIVFLPDTTRHARTLPGQTDQRLLWPSQTGLKMPLWSVSSQSDPAIFKNAYTTIETRMDEEYRRLLYVAMTRAEDRLYVCGYHGKRNPIEDSWYNYVSQGFENLQGVQQSNDGTLSYTLNQDAAPDRESAHHQNIESQKSELPDWIDVPVIQETQAASVSPSHLKDEEPPPLSPLLSHDQSRFARGNFIHKILQFLPNVAPQDRENVLNSYMQKQAGAFSDQQTAEITREILTLLNKPEFQNFFSPESAAEVPITGYTGDGRVIHGQIDRLWITPDEIWIIDYKSNRPPPAHQNDVPEAYIKQMQAYRDIMMDLYPDRAIHTALLWTYAPRLMIIT